MPMVCTDYIKNRYHLFCFDYLLRNKSALQFNIIIDHLGLIAEPSNPGGLRAYERQTKLGIYFSQPRESMNVSYFSLWIGLCETDNVIGAFVDGRFPHQTFFREGLGDRSGISDRLGIYHNMGKNRTHGHAQAPDCDHLNKSIRWKRVWFAHRRIKTSSMWTVHYDIRRFEVFTKGTNTIVK